VITTRCQRDEGRITDEHLVIEDEHAHRDVIIAEPRLDPGNLPDLGQFIKRDPDAGGDGQRNVFHGFTPARGLTVRVAEQEADLAP
jgi:hypothetical protein